MQNKDKKKEIDIFNEIVTALGGLDEESTIHIVRSVVNWFKIDLSPSAQPQQSPSSLRQMTKAWVAKASEPIDTAFSKESQVSPKQFLLEKAPSMNVEKIACLAYYLTHYRDTPDFKTADLRKLNTEAAQPKFLDASDAAKHATRSGFLVPAGKGSTKQLSAFGEQYVLALPDRDAVKVIRKRMQTRRSRSVRTQRAREVAPSLGKE